MLFRVKNIDLRIEFAEGFQCPYPPPMPTSCRREGGITEGGANFLSSQVTHTARRRRIRLNSCLSNSTRQARS
jgi:hypothetical protein